MPVYQAKDELRSGIPFGGMGAGKIEILPNGLFNAITFQNNWSQPVSGNGDYPGILGYHLGIRVQRRSASGTQKNAVLLQTVPLLDIPLVRNIVLKGDFPRAVLVYEDRRLGLDVSLEVFSPWFPFDAKNSSLPGIFFNLKVKNTGPAADVSFLFVGRNLCGEWCVGRRNRIHESGKRLDLEFSNADPDGRDARQGALRFSFQKNGWRLSYLESWNAVRKNFSFNARQITFSAWDAFEAAGELPNTRTGFTAQGENQELFGAVAARRALKPGAEANLSFAASWFFPNHPLGHRYARWFKSASQVSGYIWSRKARLRDRVRTFEKAVYSLPYPEWFNDALLTNLAPFFSSSWYVRDGRFVFYEAPVICPLMGTIDVGFYGSIPLSYFFPDLEISQLSQFAKAQRADGYIPHDLGKNRIDLPSNGTTFYQWKDLNPKFILMVYRDFLWSGSRQFLNDMYPHVRKALRWTLTTDYDGNGLPDHEGADQTFDLWEFRGANAYTASLFLAALRACEAMARLRKDSAFGRECRSHFERGRKSFEGELWNGKYFGSFCALSQLNGQWYADLLGLGLIADRRKIRTALAYILRHNRTHSSYGMVNSVLADGRLDLSSEHSRNIWSGMNYAFLSLCLSQGFPLKKLLKETRRIWHNVTQIQKSPWNQPDTIDSKTGRFVFGDSYYRNMAIWSIPIAHARRNQKTAAVLKFLRSFQKKGDR